MIFKTGKSYDGLTYEFNIKDNRIWICNSDHKLINILNNAKETGLYYNIARSTLSDYIKSGKLYKNKYYFYNSESYKNNKNGSWLSGKALSLGERSPMFDS